MVLFFSVLVLPAHNVSTKDIVLKFATEFSPTNTISSNRPSSVFLWSLFFGVGLITSPDCAFHSRNDVKGK